MNQFLYTWNSLRAIVNQRVRCTAISTSVTAFIIQFLTCSSAHSQKSQTHVHTYLTQSLASQFEFWVLEAMIQPTSYAILLHLWCIFIPSNKAWLVQQSLTRPILVSVTFPQGKMPFPLQDHRCISPCLPPRIFSYKSIYTTDKSITQLHGIKLSLKLQLALYACDNISIGLDTPVHGSLYSIHRNEGCGLFCKSASKCFITWEFIKEKGCLEELHSPDRYILFIWLSTYREICPTQHFIFAFLDFEKLPGACYGNCFTETSKL